MRQGRNHDVREQKPANISNFSKLAAERNGRLPLIVLGRNGFLRSPFPV